MVMNRFVRVALKSFVFNHPDLIDSGGRAIMSAHASDFVERLARSSERNSMNKISRAHRRRGVEYQ